MASKVDIANQALSRIGENRLTSFEDNSPNARAVRLHYDTVRDSLLRSHHWNFAGGRAELTELSTAPVFGYENQYQLPNDFLKLRTFNGAEASLCESRYQIEGQALLTDSDSAKITYTKKVTDTSLFDSLFTDALIARLAAELAQDLANSGDLRQRMLAEFEGLIAEADFADANETKPKVLSPLSKSGVLAARGSSGLAAGLHPAELYPTIVGGDAGRDGTDGANGWSPVFATVTDGSRRVQQVVGWTGGSGTAPETGYVGTSGLVSDIALATDIRGTTGAGTNWEGTYNAGTTYTATDEVGYGGSRWVANTTVVGVTPSVAASEWDQSVAQGDTGAAGDSAYAYVAYASDASGTDFTTTFDSALDYIAILATDTEIPTPVVGDFAGLWKNYKGATGAAGSNGSDGADGADGINGGTTWNFSTTTTASNPGSGSFRFNNASPASATSIYVSEEDAINTADLSAYINAWDDSSSTVKGNLIVEQVETAAIAIFTISAVADNTGWHTITVSNVAAAGTFTNSSACAFNFYRTGDKGNAGAGSGDVNGPGLAVVDDRIATWNGTSGTDIQDGLSTIADVVARANHTGTQTLSTISDAGSAAGKGVTGADASAVTGTAGTNGNIAQWNVDGDLVDGTSSATDVATAITNASAAKTKTDFLTVTQAVDLDAIETRVNELDAAVILMGGWDASLGSFPGSGTAQAGESWQVTTGGTVDSVAFSTNDRIIAITDNASTSTYASNWLKADYSDLVSSVNSQTGAVTTSQVLDGATSTNDEVAVRESGTWGGKTISELLDLATGTAADGDILYRNSGAWNLLAKGTDGEVLELSSGIPSWQTKGTIVQTAVICDEKTSGTAGGGFTAGSWVTRALNTELFDPDGIVSISSNQFTLGAGTYVLEWSCPAHNVDNHTSRLYDVTGTALVEEGSSCRNRNGDSIQTTSIGLARVTPGSSNTYRIEHRCTTTQATNGLGVPHSLQAERYTFVKIMKYS